MSDMFIATLLDIKKKKASDAAVSDSSIPKDIVTWKISNLVESFEHVLNQPQGLKFDAPGIAGQKCSCSVTCTRGLDASAGHQGEKVRTKKNRTSSAANKKGGFWPEDGRICRHKNRVSQTRLIDSLTQMRIF